MTFKPNTPFLKVIAQLSDQVIARLEIIFWFKLGFKPNTPFFFDVKKMTSEPFRSVIREAAKENKKDISVRLDTSS